MSKRHRDSDALREDSIFLKSGDRPIMEDGAEALEFEDEFEDEFESESEDEIFEAGVDGRPDAEREAEEQADAMDVDQSTFIPGRSKLSEGQTLAPDLSVYELFHQVGSDWPCLSVDIVRDNLGDNRTSYPATVYAVAGTQAERGHEKENHMSIMKLSSLSRQEKGEESESEDEDDDADENADPILETKTIPMTSTTNRIRAHQIPQTDSSTSFPTTFTAAMQESGHVLIHDITPHLTAFDTPGTTISPSQNKPVSTIRAHKNVEGYALDWSRKHPEGKLVTGDCSGLIYATTRNSGGGWVTDSRPFTGHTGSVEELQWSTSEKNIFASGSSDGTIKVWDVRSKSHTSALSVKASSTDINVLSWGPLSTNEFLLASGHEDGTWSIWDLRQWKSPQFNPNKPSPVASFNFHKEQITSIEWHPSNDSMLLVCAGDNTVTQWDVSVEHDDEESRETAGVADVPPHLLFVHYMEQVKEGHWHPQIPGVVVATGGSGFGVFKTISV